MREILKKRERGKGKRERGMEEGREGAWQADRHWSNRAWEERGTGLGGKREKWREGK